MGGGLRVAGYEVRGISIWEFRFGIADFGFKQIKAQGPAAGSDFRINR